MKSKTHEELARLRVLLKNANDEIELFKTRKRSDENEINSLCMTIKFQSNEMAKIKQKVEKQRGVIDILKSKLQETRDKIGKTERINEQLNSEIKALKDETQKKNDRNYSRFEAGIFTGITLVFAVVGFVSTLVFLFK